MVDDLIAPFAGHFVSNVELGVKDPKEEEAFFAEFFDLNVHDFLVAHGVVVEGKLAVGEHEGGVVLLATLDAPGRVEENDVEAAHLFDQEVEVEVTDIAVDVGLDLSELGEDF